MVSMSRIHREIGHSVCRHCICEVYGVHGLTKDCYYDYYPQKCRKVRRDEEHSHKVSH